MAWRPTWNEPDNAGQGRFRHVQFGAQRPGGFNSRTMTSRILIVTIAVFLVFQLFGQNISIGGQSLARLVESHAALRADQVIPNLWQLITFQFLHGSVGHIFWNMFGLWMFGRVVEQQIGSKKFFLLYLVGGIAGGALECVFNHLMASPKDELAMMLGQPNYLSMPIIGASAGVCAVLVAYAMINPNAKILLMFVFPIKAKWFAVGYAAMTTLWALESLNEGGGGIAHAAHFGGMAFAFFFLAATGTVAGRYTRPIHRFFNGLKGFFVTPTSSNTYHPNHPVMGGPNAAGGSGVTAKEEQQLDDILRKVHEKGVDSLSEKEGKFLREMSQRKRGD